MRVQHLAGSAVSVVMMLSGVVRAQAEIRTDGLRDRKLETWNAIVAVVEATGTDGRLLHPTLHRLYSEIASSPHAVRIVIPETTGSSAIAGRFWLESVGTDGRHEASITLNLRMIDRVERDSSNAKLVTFEGLDRTKRYAQVLGHELAHAAWTFAHAERVRLVADVQGRSLRLASQARMYGVAAEGFSEAVEENERRVRRLEEPALVAEAAIHAELRARR